MKTGIFGSHRKGPRRCWARSTSHGSAVNGEVTSLNSGRWDWLAGGELSDRDYRNVFAGPSLPPQVLLSGFQLKQLAQLNYELVRVPERRFDSKASITSQAGRIWSAPSHSFEKLQGSVFTHWYPQISGDDYAMQWQVRSGEDLWKCSL